MIECSNLFYFARIASIGGIETFFYQLAKKYKDIDIVIMYKTADNKQLKRLKKYVKCIKYTGQKVKCKKAFFNYNVDIIDNVEAEEYYQIAHGDYASIGVKPSLHKKITTYLGVSNVVCNSFTKMTGKKTELAYNPIVADKPNKILKLISATRLSGEKGKKRMVQLAKILDKAGIKYIWLVFTNDKGEIDNPNVIHMNPTIDVIDYIAEADYLVQLSDGEGYCYSVVESLLVGTPVIVTEMPVMEEIGVKDGINGFVLKFDMSNVNPEKIYKGLNKFEYKAKEDSWGDLLVKTKSNYKEEEEMKYKVKSVADFKYDGYEEVEFVKKERENGSWIYKGDIFYCDEEQYNYLNGNNRLKLKAVELIEIKDNKPKEEKKKKTTKKKGE